MNTLELFCGTKSFSKIAKKLGHNIYTIDVDSKFNPDLVIDINNLSIDDIPNYYEFIWASPPCTGFSVASISKHWGGGYRKYIPKSQTAKIGLQLLDKTISIISKKEPKYWCIENPIGVMRKVIDDSFGKHNIVDFRRVSVTYCQYGDRRMKPTDIWTNLNNWTGKRCKNGDKCHVPAPRGSKTGTQGLKNATERGKIPPLLIYEILKSTEG
jgi:hypothetical protein